MTKLKKIGAIVLATALALSMVSAATAADTGAVELSSTTITFVKEIQVFNDETTTVYGPGVEYTYTVAKVNASAAGGALLTGTPNKTITDKDGDSITVRNGVENGVSFTDDKATFAENTELSVNGGTAYSWTDNVTLTITPANFPSAGVYRYLITETAPANMTAAGITRGANYNSTRYLDVYIKNGTAGLEVAGYVMFIVGSGASDNTIDSKTSSNTTITGKTTGFVEVYDSTVDDTAGSSGSGMGDKYYTYNYTITKTITGGLADKHHEFPFAIETSVAVAEHQFVAATTGDFTAGVTSGVASIGANIAGKLADGETITLKGLPANTTIAVTETNDTYDTYKVKVEDTTGGAIGTETTVAASGTKGTGSLVLTNYETYNTPNVAPTAAYTATTFTNDLSEISPTGVVLRFAPYILILIGGIALLLISRKHKKHADEE